MHCKNPEPHARHWHTVFAGNITIAGGECDGSPYVAPEPDGRPEYWTAMSGPQRVHWAVARDAGWEWCDVHRAARWDGAAPCRTLHKPVPRGSWCLTHGRQHPEGWFDECWSEVDEAIAHPEDWEYAPPPLVAVLLPRLTIREKIAATWACWRRGRHEWGYDGPTLGGIWLRCIDCRTGEEFLPGCHEPAGGEDVWRRHVAGLRAHVEGMPGL